MKCSNKQISNEGRYISTSMKNCTNEENSSKESIRKIVSIFKVEQSNSSSNTNSKLSKFSMFKSKQDVNQASDCSEQNINTEKVKYKASDRRKNYQQKKKTESIENFNIFFNSLDSFEGNNLIYSSKRRKSDYAVMGVELDGSKNKYSSTRLIRNVNEIDVNSKHLKDIYSKNRSRSFHEKTLNHGELFHRRRLLSDFHDLAITKQNIAIEFFTELNVFQEIENKQLKNQKKINKLEEDHDSAESSSISEEENEKIGMIRFFSLPILPSEKDCLEINFDDDLERIHKVNYSKTTIKDFFLLRAVSHGAYGKVCLARKKQTRDLFAIKVMDKSKMEEKGVTQLVMNERDILNKVNNNYIVRGVYTFQTNKYLYIVMEYMKGGDFSNLLENIGALKEDAAKFYLAQLVLAIEYLHENNIIHRDLKPDNILIDGEGFIKLTDFGLSEINLNNIKMQYEKTIKNSNREINDSEIHHVSLQNVLSIVREHDAGNHSTQENKLKLSQNLSEIQSKVLCKKNCDDKKKLLGTPDYIAPEAILGKDVTKSVDWWALGVITCEFMTGALPFNDSSPEKIFQNIINKNIKWPQSMDEYLSKPAVNFIQELMEYEPDKRLGFKDVNDIKQHEFFKDVDWNQINKMSPPFIPEVQNDIDTTFFAENKKFDMKELEIIQNDMDNFETNLNDFDSTVFNTLAEINKKEAQKAMVKAVELSKEHSEKMNSPNLKDRRFNILNFDD